MCFVRILLGVLLAANLVVAGYAFNVFGSSPEALNQALVAAEARLQADQTRLTRSRVLTSNIGRGKAESDTFLASYFTSRRHTYSTIISEITETAKTAGMKTQEGTIAPLDPIEGSDDLSMMTISINFEGELRAVREVRQSARSLPAFSDHREHAGCAAAEGRRAEHQPQTARFRQRRPGRSPMTTGADPKKIAILAVLLVIAAVVLYFNVFAGDSDSDKTVRSVTPAPIAVAPVVTSPARPAIPGVATTAAYRRMAMVSEFKIRQGVEPGEEKPDPATIDPTLRLDLLAKLQQVEPPASMRNIFQYGAAPPPPAAVAAKPIELPKNTPKIAINQIPAARPGPPPPPAALTAPPMTFKYYGYKVSKSDGRKEAFLLDGEDIIIAGENDAVKRGRYKVVRIGINSITIEDTQFKSTQTLPLQADAVV